MMDKIISLLKCNIIVPGALLYNYKNLNIEDKELIVLIYLLNEKDNCFNPKAIEEKLNFSITDVMNIISSLSTKDLIRIETEIINDKHKEFINLENLYKKLAFSIMNEESNNEKTTNLFDVFEKEFGRTISPMEYEIINAWLSAGYSEEFIVLGLKEAIYNGVTNLRYIDKILHEWAKKGIKNKNDVEKERRNFSKKKSTNKELYDYDWLNDANE